MADRPRIGARIQRARKLLGLSQKELGALAGASERTVGNWENDRKYPQNIPLLERALGITLEEESPEPKPEPDPPPTAGENLDELEKEFNLWLANRRRSLREGRKESPNANLYRHPSRKAV